jgi:hypothetical protein
LLPKNTAVAKLTGVGFGSRTNFKARGPTKEQTEFKKNNPSRPERARVEKGDSGGKPDKQPNDDRKVEGDKGQGGWFGAARQSPKSSIAPAKQSKFWVRF